MSHNPNNDELIKNALRQGDVLVESVFSSIKSQHELNPCNDGKRSSDVLLSTIDKIVEVEQWNKDMQTKYGNMSAELEKVKKENDLIKNYIQQIRSVIQSANFEQICTEYRVKIIKIMDNLLYRTDFKLIDTDKERLQKQLYIALTGLKTIKSMEFERYLMANGWRAVNQMRETAKIYIKRVEELNK